MDSKRATNFSTEEEKLLILLVDKFKHIIECKKSNVTTWQEKEKTWKNIEKEFNSASGKAFRHSKHLKEKYANLKKKAKRKFTEEKLQIKKTGGGTFTPILVSDVDIAIKNILGSQIEGVQNSYDSDAAQASASNTYCATEIGQNGEALENLSASGNIIELENVQSFGENVHIEFIDTISNVQENASEKSLNLLQKDVPQMEQNKTHQESHDWSSYTPKNLKQQKANKLCFKKTNATNSPSTTMTAVAEEKIKFIKLQKEKFLLEHKLKMEILHLEKEFNEKRLEHLQNNQ